MSAPVTVYYVAGALLTIVIGDVYERVGPRLVVAAGSAAMAAGLATLGVVNQPWQLYPAFLVMSAGWGAMSGAAINIVLAPWFQRRRGLAVSLAFNGAPLGGVIVAPVLIPLIGALGFATTLALAAQTDPRAVLLRLFQSDAPFVIGDPTDMPRTQAYKTEYVGKLKDDRHGFWLLLLATVFVFLGLLVGALRELDLKRGLPE